MENTIKKSDVSPDTLYTTKEIMEMYHVTYTTVLRWIRNGLKCLRSSSYLFRIKWVDDFIEKQAELEIVKKQAPIANVVKFKPKVQRFSNDGEMKLKLEDFI